MRNVSYALILMLSCMWLAGCNATPKRKAFTTIASVGYSVDAAMLSWGDFVRSGESTSAQERKVAKAFDDYIRVYNAALTVLDSDQD